MLKSESQQCVEKMDLCPHKSSSKDSARPWKLWREKGKSTWLIEGQSHWRGPLPAGWSTPWDLSLDAVLFTLFTQFVSEITEGEVREEIWWSVNFFSSSLLLWPMERTGKSFCDQKIWSLLGPGWWEHRGVWFKFSYNIALLKPQGKMAVSCKELLTFLPFSPFSFKIIHLSSYRIM